MTNETTHFTAICVCVDIFRTFIKDNNSIMSVM
uniref:Uncharacterized protein n=1 Tax=Rhizophora mucronata TaxID=61149 RepID=A0A2P2QL13_RHIMU